MDAVTPNDEVATPGDARAGIDLGITGMTRASRVRLFGRSCQRHRRVTRRAGAGAAARHGHHGDAMDTRPP
jgi:hypothetical protein